MKSTLSILSAFLLFSFALVTFAQEVKDEKKDEKQVEKTEEKVEVKGKVVDDGVIYGEDLKADIAEVTIADLLAKPDDYNGKTVKINGNITDVCQASGCWIMLSDGTNSIRVSTGHKFFFPKDAAGKVISDGTFKIIEETEEHARHMNEESKNPTMKTEDIKGPQKTFVLVTTGTKILK